MPTGVLPTGGLPTGDLPTGDLPTGELPTGDLPTGDLPTGELPTGELPTDYIFWQSGDYLKGIKECGIKTINIFERLKTFKFGSVGQTGIQLERKKSL